MIGTEYSTPILKRRKGAAGAVPGSLKNRIEKKRQNKRLIQPYDSCEIVEKSCFKGCFSLKKGI